MDKKLDGFYMDLDHNVVEPEVKIKKERKKKPLTLGKQYDKVMKKIKEIKIT